MARRSNGGAANLQEAIALLIHNQAALVQTQASFVGEMAEMNRRFNESMSQIARRFAVIEEDLEDIKAILRGLPEAIRQKIGFKTK